MTDLRIDVKTRALPISTRLIRFWSAAEHFYYVLLFTGSTAAGENPWRSWLCQGFHIATKSPPPGVAPEDRVTLISSPGVKSFWARLSGGQEKTLQALAVLLGAIDARRRQIGAHEAEKRLAAFREDPEIGGTLIDSMTRSLKRHGISEQERQAFVTMIEDGLLAWSDPDILGVEIRLT